MLTESQTLSLIEMVFSREPAFSVLVPLGPVPTGCDTEKARRHWIALKEKTPRFEDPKSFIVDSKQAYALL